MLKLAMIRKEPSSIPTAGDSSVDQEGSTVTRLIVHSAPDQVIDRERFTEQFFRSVPGNGRDNVLDEATVQHSVPNSVQHPTSRYGRTIKPVSRLIDEVS